MRPLLKPALRRVWRDPATLQVGVDPARAVLLTGLDDRDSAFVRALDGTRTLPEVITDAEGAIGQARALALLDMLSPALQDAAAPTRPLMELPQVERERLAPDLADLSLGPCTDGGVGALARRLAATVLVQGAGRVGAAVAVLLAAAGVGRITVDDPGTVTPADTGPGGLSADDVGLPRQAALAAAIARVAPRTQVSPPPPGGPAHLVVLAEGPHLLSRCDTYVQAGLAHLPVHVEECTGVIGPLVLPGTSACLRCVEAARSSRDAAWPRLAAQRDASAGAGGVVLATLVAAQTAVQALSHLDGFRPATVNGVVEVTMPEGAVRRRSWRPHPACGCRWSV